MYEIKSRIDPCLPHHGRGPKLLLVLASLRGLHGTEKAKFCVTMVSKHIHVCLHLVGRFILGTKNNYLNFMCTLISYNKVSHGNFFVYYILYIIFAYSVLL